jgi:O-antigen/teichoic acid export membrane protein
MRSVPFNIRWNLVGLALPILVAVVAIPLLIKILGNERFGTLAIVWVVTGYLAMFDLGMGQATIKFASEYAERRHFRELNELVWNSVIGHFTLGLTAALVMAGCTPWLVEEVFAIPEPLKPEARRAFYLVAVSIPPILLANCLRGVLEALRRFDLANLVKGPASVINYLGPLLVVQFTNDLSAIVAFISACRLATLIAYTVLCYRVLHSFSLRFVFSPGSIRPLVLLGGWLTVSSLMSPIIGFVDRLYISIFFSMEAVTYYVTPYEAVTKLWILSAGILGVFFPVFSSLSTRHTDELRTLSVRVFLFLLMATIPLALLMLLFGRDLLNLWVGPDFAAYSSTVAKWLVLGVLVNVLAQVPYTLLTSSGRASVVAMVQLVEVPIYLWLAWTLLRAFGTVGVAMAWTLRAVIDAALLMIAARGIMRITADLVWPHIYKFTVIGTALLACWMIDSTLQDALLDKALISAPLLTLFAVWLWHFALDRKMRDELVLWMRQIVTARS